MNNISYITQKDFKIICTLFQSIIDNPNDSRYQSLNISKLCYLFDNSDKSINLLKNYNFVEKGSRLVFDERQSAYHIKQISPSDAKINPSTVTYRDRISTIRKLHLQAIRSQVNTNSATLQNEYDKECQRWTVRVDNQIYSFFGFIDYDDKFWETIELDDIVEEIPNNIFEQYIPLVKQLYFRKDILTLKKLFYQLSVRYISTRKPNDVFFRTAKVEFIENTDGNKNFVTYPQIVSTTAKYNIGKEFLRYVVEIGKKTTYYPKEFESQMKYFATQVMPNIVNYKQECKKNWNKLFGNDFGDNSTGINHDTNTNKQLQWKCYVCNCINVDNHHSTTNNNNENNWKCLTCNQSINPLFFARLNKSQTYSIVNSLKFGLRRIDCMTLTTQRVFKNGMEYLSVVQVPIATNKAMQTINKALAKKDDKHIRIVINFANKVIIEFISDRNNNNNNNNVYLEELNQIISEFIFYDMLFSTNDGKRLHHMDFDQLHGISYDGKYTGYFYHLQQKVIKFGPKSALIEHSSSGTPYYLEWGKHFHMQLGIKPEYKLKFSHKFEPCPKLIQDGKCNAVDEKSITKWVDNAVQNKNVDPDDILQKLKKIVQHLSSYVHFELDPDVDSVNVNTEQKGCEMKEQCNSYNRILNDNLVNYPNSFDGHKQRLLDRIHLHLYNHKMNPSVVMHDVTDSKDTAWFEYVKLGDESVLYHEQYLRAKSNHDIKWICEYYTDFGKLCLLIQEVIQNGFEKDLLPKLTINSNKNGIEIQYDHFDFEKDHVKRCKISNTDHEWELREQSLMDELAKYYGIMDTLTEKMNHKRHEKMGFCLTKSELFSLILYTNGDCNYDLGTCQRNDTSDTKWKYFDFFLNRTIVKLNGYEQHVENIYTGVCGVYLNLNHMKSDQDVRIAFKTNVSFSTDLKKAIEFRGQDGMIIGLIMNNCVIVDMGAFKACDVSWVSKFPREKEILCSKCSWLYVSKSKTIMTYENGGQQQWIVCDDSKHTIQTLFQKTFVMKRN